MIRFLLTLVILVVLGGGGALYAAYGEVEPCRVLAVEHARRAQTALGMPVEKGLEPWTRMATSQMSTGKCVHELFDSWGERLKGKSDPGADSD